MSLPSRVPRPPDIGPPNGPKAKPAGKKLGGSAFKKKEWHVFHDDGEGNWLVSYADMMTLLLGFFVILAAFSNPDARKMEKLKKETAKSMGGIYERPFQELTEALKNVLTDARLESQMHLEETADGVTLSVRGALFFDSGSTELKEAAARLMGQLSEVIVRQAKGFNIVVEGHTDDTPISSKQFASNWELSSARASTVVRLLEERGFPHLNLSPVGYADTQPIVPNRDPDGQANPSNQALNRRVVIRIKRQLPERVASESDGSLAPSR